MSTELRIAQFLGSLIIVPAVFALAACGGGTDTDAGTDACGSGICLGEAGMDGGGVDMGRDMNVGPDLGADSGSNLTPCDPSQATDSCGAGMHCAVTLHISPLDGGMNTIGYGECVPQPATHLVLGSTCGGFVAVAGMAGLDADPCGDGLFCWNNPETTIRRCHPICDPMHACANAGEFCIGLNGTALPSFGFCATATNCDPLVQNCRTGQGCYLVPDDTGALYSSCFTTMGVTEPDGGTGSLSMAGGDCGYLGNCEPGTQCVNLPLPDGGTQGICRSICDTTGGTDAGVVGVDAGDDAGVVGVDAGDDAGVVDVDAGDVDAGTPTDAGPPDAGPPSRLCTGSAVCMPFMATGDASVAVSQPVGFCM